MISSWFYLVCWIYVTVMMHWKQCKNYDHTTILTKTMVKQVLAANCLCLKLSYPFNDDTNPLQIRRQLVFLLQYKALHQLFLFNKDKSFLYDCLITELLLNSFVLCTLQCNVDIDRHTVIKMQSALQLIFIYKYIIIL